MASHHDKFTVTIKNCSNRNDPRHYVVFAALPEIKNGTLSESPSSIHRTVCYTPTAAVPHNGQESFTTQKQYFAIIGDLQQGDQRRSIQLRNLLPVHLGSPGAGDGSVVEARCDEGGMANLAQALVDDPNPMSIQNHSGSQAFLETSPTGTFTILCVDDSRRHSLVVGIGTHIGYRDVVLAAVPYNSGAEYIIRPREGFLIKQIDAEVGDIVPNAAEDAFGLFFGFGRSVTMSETPEGRIVPDLHSEAASPDPQLLDTALPGWDPKWPTSLPPRDRVKSHTTPGVTTRAPHASPPRSSPPAITSLPLAASPPLLPYSQASSSNSRRQNGSIREDKFNLLRKYDTILLIDDSGSMYGSLWSDVEKLLAQLAPIITKYDDDGIDLYFLNHETEIELEGQGRAMGGYFGIRDEATVNNIFSSREEPFGDAATPTGDRLETILASYLEYYEEKRTLKQLREVKPLNIIVITDGDADDDVESVIVSAAKTLDEWRAPLTQVGIQFFQIGNDQKAQLELKRLDSKLKGKHKIRDMVDTVSWDQWDPNDPETGHSLSADGILKVLLGAVNRKLDKGGELND
ncbi:hypothetical protein EG329_013982 [Mollisiaceae sp. DMI_Dod_QoI]|nr:hypothetical protein EG329_013982 [Helotiales sp. DMI_Dod_QoI]